MSFDGTPYQHSQVVTNRRTSTYDNILTSNETDASTVGTHYTCSVSNRFGTSSRSAVIGGNDVQSFLSKRAVRFTEGILLLVSCVCIHWQNV